MAAVVERPALPDRGAGQERDDMNPGLRHGGQELPIQGHGPQRVVEEADLDPRLGPLDQHVTHPRARAVGLPEDRKSVV